MWTSKHWEISSPPGLLYKSFWKKHYTQKGTTSISHPKNLTKGKGYLHNEESISTNGQNSQLALNDNIKLINININPKFKWIKCPNQRHRKENWIKSQNPSHKQGHTKTQNKALVEDLPIKWREKTKQNRSCNFHLWQNRL